MKKHVLLLLIVTMAVSTFSCDFVKAENDAYLYNNDVKTKRVITNIEEAKILSDISILNENIIALSKLSLEKSNLYSMKMLSNKLKKDSAKIKKQLIELADKKLILLPSRLNENEIEKFNVTDSVSFSEAYLI
jgi:hypothetical protein